MHQTVSTQHLQLLASRSLWHGSELEHALHLVTRRKASLGHLHPLDHEVVHFGEPGPKVHGHLAFNARLEGCAVHVLLVPFLVVVYMQR